MISVKTFRQFFVYAFFLTVIILVTGAVVFLIVFVPTPQVTVPNVQDKHLVDAILALQEKNLFAQVELKFTDNPADKDRVLKSFPVAGSLVRERREVLLTVSRGAQLSEVPDFVNRRFSIVMEEFEGLYSKVNILSLKTVNWVFSNEYPVERIIAQEPFPSTSVDRLGTEVNLLVSRGSLLSDELIPQLRGENFGSALAYLGLHGFEFEFYRVDAISDVQNIEFFTDDEGGIDEGVIVEQFPVAGAPYKPDNILRLGVYIPPIPLSQRVTSEIESTQDTQENNEADLDSPESQTVDVSTTQNSYVDIISITIPEYVKNRRSNNVVIRVTRNDRVTGTRDTEDYFQYTGKKTQINLPFLLESGMILETLYNNEVIWRQTIQ